MHLKVVVDNTVKQNVEHKFEKETKTCRTHCFYFDSRTQKCGIFKNIEADDPKTVLRCQKFSDWTLEEDDEEIYELIEDDFTVEFDDENFLFELMGDKFSEEQSKYPMEPDFSSNRDDAIWYVSPDKSFGCWVINKSKKRFVAVNPEGNVETGWGKKIYKSPFPLHDHESSIPLKSRMAWYVDEQGWGQYVLLINGKIEMLSAPKPSNWGK
ncbi:hypothetical protein [Alkalihalobacillus sp. BA299]|uniref:hypothetical protein n=1 Tax=Alkalihalobacillus sp. BA299 TaxID=2815938 RepID=UPI001ADD016F|nr:hypothetical protein [Alkalihalobacillus sp. BA299]